MWCGVGSLSVVWSLLMSSYEPLLDVLMIIFDAIASMEIGRLWEWKRAEVYRKKMAVLFRTDKGTLDRL